MNTQPVWLNGQVFVYKLSVSGFEFSCSHFNLRNCACFDRGFSRQSGIYRVYIRSKRVSDMIKTHFKCSLSIESEKLQSFVVFMGYTKGNWSQMC